MTTRTGRVARWACALAVAICGSLHAQPVPAPPEHDLKAAFLFNFAKYVEWPKAAFAAPGEPFRLCVLGDPQFSRVVAETVQGESVDGRTFATIEPSSDDAVRTCHVLFIGRLELARVAVLLSAIANAPILTVGDSTAVLTRGGVIALVVDDNRVRFDVNVAAARMHGLTISSKMLRVARRVVDNPVVTP